MAIYDPTPFSISVSRQYDKKLKTKPPFPGWNLRRLTFRVRGKAVALLQLLHISPISRSPY